MGLLRSTVEGTILDVNRACLEMFGYTDRASLFDVNASRLYSDPGDRELIHDGVARNGSVRDFSARMLRRDGTVFWAQIGARAVRDPAGRLVGFLGTILDVTRQRIIEEELRQKEQLLRLITENVEEILCVRSVDTGRVIYLNAAWDDVTGRDRSAALRDAFSMLEVVHPEDREKLRPFFEDPSIARFDVEFRIIHRDGMPRRLRSRSFPLLDSAGRIGRTVVIMQDITQYREPETAASAPDPVTRRSP